MICARDAASWWPSNANSQSGSFIEHLSQKKPSSKERPGKPRDVVSWLTNFLSRNPEQQNGHVLKCRSAVLADAGEDGDREGNSRVDDVLDSNFHPLQQRPNDKKFKHENW